MTQARTQGSAFFGGHALLMSKEISWSIREGTSPHIQTFHMRPEDAQDLVGYGANVPFSLQMYDWPAGSEQSQHSLIVNDLYLLDVKPGPHPWISEVTVADKRWLWPYSTVLRRYNMRRHVGVKRILNNDSFAVPFDRADNVQYWRWSLRKRKSGELVTWDLFRLVKDVMEAVHEPTKNFSSVNTKVKIDQHLTGRLLDFPIEDFVIDDNGDSAVARLLGKIPGVGVYIDYDGNTVLYNKTTGREAEIVEGIMPEMRDMGHTDLVLKNRLRPKWIEYYFTQEVEVRFDYEEVTSAKGQTVAENGDNPLDNRRELENVLSVTDYELDVPEIDSANPQCQGTWITVDQALRSWGNVESNLVPDPIVVDHDFIQKAFIPHNDMWAQLGLAGSTPDSNAALKPWPGRAAELMTRYRQTFRINPWWMDRALSIRPYRIGTINQQSGQRAPMRAWSDYCIMYGQRAFIRNATQGGNFNFYINRAAFTRNKSNASSTDNFNSDMEVCPAIVNITDHDQGIIHLNYVGNNPKTGDFHMILPSQVQVDGAAGYGLANMRKDKTFNITWDSSRQSAGLPSLSPDFKMTTILTMVPSAPNNKKQLYKIVVFPGEVSKFFPNGIGACDGPPMQVRIGPNVETARIPWNDSKKNEIEGIFGVRNGVDAGDEADVTGPVEKNPVEAINEPRGNSTNFGGSLRLIAQAHATTVWASLVDRYEGETVTHFQGEGVHIAGYASEVRHSLAQSGVMTTSVNFPPQVPRLNLAQFLDSNSRNAIFKLVAVEK